MIIVKRLDRQIILKSRGAGNHNSLNRIAKIGYDSLCQSEIRKSISCLFLVPWLCK